MAMGGPEDRAFLAVVRALVTLTLDERKRVLESALYLYRADRLVPGTVKDFLSQYPEKEQPPVQ